MRRLLSSRVGVIATAIALAIEGVDCATICYPSCDTYATTALNQITPWNDNIVLPKFDSGDSRILNKVTIRTKVSIQTQIFVKCTASTSFCDNDLTGEVSAGVDIGVRPSSTQSNSLHTELPRYWGRWGGYRPGTLNDASQYDPASRVGTDAATNPFFIEYTYPFFDIPQYTPPAPAEAGTPYGVWSYLGQIGTQQSRILYTKDGKFGSAELGNVVIYNNPDPMFGDPETYSTEQYNVPANTLSTVKYGQGGTATPFNSDVPVGTLTYNSVVYEKTISDTDYAGAAGGGVNNDITPEDMFLLFSDPAGVADIEWDADATGFISTVLTGGNYVIRQETKGHVEMQIQYDYTGNAITQQDPQFSGFQGQSFQVHGYPGSYFHLMSAPQFQMNGRFAYLANGHCNYKHTPCWTHPGTYVDDIAIVVDELLVRITAGPVGQGYNVRINDEPFHAHAHAHNTTDDMMMNHTDTDSRAAFVPTKFYDAATRLTVHLRSPLEVVVRTDLFAFTIHNADHFFNIDSQLLVRPILIMGREASPKYPHPNTGKPWFPQFPIHGFVGQTWANAQYPHNKQYQGDVDDYLETRPYATESTYSQYYKKFDDKNMNWDN